MEQLLLTTVRDQEHLITESKSWVGSGLRVPSLLSSYGHAMTVKTLESLRPDDKFELFWNMHVYLLLSLR